MWYHDITTEAKNNVGNWEKFEAFRGPYYRGRDVLEKLDRERHVVIFYETYSHPNGYEKGSIDKANEKALFDEIDEYLTGDPATIAEAYVGADRALIVTAIDEHGNETKAWEKIVEIAGALSDYPILDDDLHSGMELEAIDTEVENICNDDLEIETLKTALYEGISEYGPEDYPATKVLKRALSDWWCELDSFAATTIIEVITEQNPDMINVTVRPTRENIAEMSRADLEEMQRMIADELRLKAV